MRERVTAARVGRLATVRPGGGPHVVPVTFAFAGDEIVSAVDHKPKRSAALQRLANIAADPRVSLLVDAYDEDWGRLWWIRVDGTAVIIRPGDAGHPEAVAALAVKYEQYRQIPPSGAVIAVRASRWSSWHG